MVESTVVLTLDIRDWVTILSPSASALTAITALGVSLWVDHKQRRIQRAQLQERLLDRQYAIFVAVREFLDYVFVNDESVNLYSSEFRRFRDVRQQAEFLFKADVTNYMKALNKAVDDLYIKCRERDKLTKMKQVDAALNIEISRMLIEIEAQFAEKRNEVFSPYLQLIPSEKVEGSAGPMRLNGWQRLWVVMAMMWVLPVVVRSYEFWPTTVNISKGDVYLRMKSDDGRRLSDYYDTLATQLGGVNLGNPLARFEPVVTPPPPGYTLVQGGAFDVVGAHRAGYTDDEIARYLSQTRNFDWQGALKSGSSELEVIGSLSKQKSVEGPIVDITDGHTVQFLAGTSQGEMNQTTKAYYTGLRRVLTLKRATFVGEALASWLVPAFALYALGWAVGWVRRGFGVS